MRTTAAKEIRFNGVHCKLVIEKHDCGVAVLRISGTDVGEFGDEPMVELKQCFRAGEPIHLFIDAREVRGASIHVSGDWAEWLRKHKANLESISMLTGSRFIEVTADFVRRFADLQGIMRIYTDSAAFDAAVEASIR